MPSKIKRTKTDMKYPNAGCLSLSEQQIKKAGLIQFKKWRSPFSRAITIHFHKFSERYEEIIYLSL